MIKHITRPVLKLFFHYRGLLVLMGMITVINASAQDVAVHIIKGIVTDKTTAEPLAGAMLATLPATISTLSDESGAFELELADSVEKIIVQYLGYATDTMDVPHKDTTLHIAMQGGATIDEVLIRKRKKSTEINMLNTGKMENMGGKELAKAACCNLSESFETTPSVDVGFTDAVSGYKQITMLGLAAANTFFTRENIPDIRGLASVTGLTFTPGAWVESMQLSKGSGSVVNGYEGAAGQINVEWQKPFEENTPKLYLNGYQSIQGRSEGNMVYNHVLNDRLSTNLLLHARGDWMRVDQNGDGFLDQPLGNAFIGANRWFYFSPDGWEVQGGIKGILTNNTGGEKDYKRDNNAASLWGYQNDVKRAEAWAKIGKVYDGKPWKSMGLQLAGTYHDQDSRYGLRDYAAKQQSFYANYIYQSIIGNTNHVIKAGAGLSYDHFDERFQNVPVARNETVPGAFIEYTYNWLTKFSAVAGLRADYDNIFGGFVTPRLHLRYAPGERTVFRASIGRAQRSNNILADNIGFMASGRAFVFPANYQNDQYPFGLKPEVAWNMGLNFTQKFTLDYRDGAFSMDYYYTDFTNQAVVDIETPGIISFYNLAGKSYAHSFQAQLDYEVIHNFDVRLAYRFYDVKTTYEGVLKEKPLVAKNRAFANLAYETRNGWKLDYTVQWTGAKRLPARYYDATTFIAAGYSKDFVTMNAQITKGWKDGLVELYAGAENITGYMQPGMISGLDDPFGNKFDASMIWGPGMGRNFYLGFRYKIR